MQVTIYSLILFFSCSLLLVNGHMSINYPENEVKNLKLGGHRGSILRELNGWYGYLFG